MILAETIVLGDVNPINYNSHEEKLNKKNKISFRGINRWSYADRYNSQVFHWNGWKIASDVNTNR